MTSTKRKTLRKPLDYYLALQYSFNVRAEPEGGYVALFPDLPGCMTQGETLEELVAMAEDARRGWIETEYERGNEIPLPSYTEEYSGKFNVRIPKSLHRSLAEAAEREGMSLNQYVVYVLSRGDAQARVENRLVEMGGAPVSASSPQKHRAARTAMSRVLWDAKRDAG
jgi:predicted RNase H-like HicB family nuclease